jgi:putative Holliday junction resolvase
LILMGLDVGERRIGVAVSDPLGKTAQPLATIQRDETVVDQVLGLVRESGAERLVVGLPLLMDGSEGEQARLVREFARTLAPTLDVPIDFVDERLTTREAEAVLSRGGVKRGQRKEASDRVAAALILRAYMDGSPGE